MSGRATASGAPAETARLKVVRRGSRKLIKRDRSRRLASLAILGGIVAIAVVFGVLLEQVVLAQSAFKMTRVRERLAEAEERHQELLLQAATLESSDRIERFARDELGMVEPGPGDVQYLSADIVLGSRRTAANTAPAKAGGGGRPPAGSVATGGP